MRLEAGGGAHHWLASKCGFLRTTRNRIKPITTGPFVGHGSFSIDHRLLPAHCTERQSATCTRYPTRPAPARLEQSVFGSRDACAKDTMRIVCCLRLACLAGLWSNCRFVLTLASLIRE